MLSNRERSYLRGLANNLEALFQVGKGGVSPSVTEAVDSCLEANELVKISVLKNCDEDLKLVAEQLSGRTRSQIVQLIGRKIILYRESKTNKSIVLPKK